MTNSKAIRVSKETVEHLDKNAKPRESYDETIRRLLDVKKKLTRSKK